MSKLFAILPCYNEELNIGELIDKWYSQADELKDSGYELVIVGIDDCSTDNTKKIIEDKSKQYSNVFLLPHKVNKGLCGGLNSAIGYFLKNGGKDDLMALMDGDNTHDPKYIHAMLKKLKDGNKDCVIASRYCKDSAVIGVANHREFMSDMAKLYYSFVLKVPGVKDYTCGYRLYTYSIIEKLVEKYGEDPIVEKSFACMMELLYKIYTVGATFDETGFELRYDFKQGQSKMNVIKTMKKSLTTAVKLKAEDNRNKRKDLKTSSFMIYGFFAFFVAILLSSTYFFVLSDDFGHDAGIFAYIGYAVTQGKSMYVEVWDNKGPLLYLIEALGVLINYRYGISLLEFVTLFSSMAFLYKTAKLFVSKEISVACAIASMMPLVVTLEGGNHAEEYAIPFTVIAFYLIAKFFKNNFSLKAYEMIIVGICISAVFQLRLNLLAFLGCAVLGVIIVLVKNKEFKKLGTVFGFAFAGFLILLIPVCIYLASTGALKECIDTAYLDILGSFSHVTMIYKLNSLNNMLLDMARTESLFLIIGFVFYYVLRSLIKKSGKDSFDTLCLISVFGLMTTFWANSVSGAKHSHYFMAFVPVLIIPAVALAKVVVRAIEQNSDGKNIGEDFKAGAVIILVLLVSAPSLFSLIYDSFSNLDPDYMSYSRAVAKYVEENTEETDLIQVFGDASAVASYYSSKRFAASKYFYYNNGRFSEEAKTEFATRIYEDVIKTHPKLIMFEDTGVRKKHEDFVEHTGHADEWNAFIEKYYEVAETDLKYTVYKHK